MDGACAWCGDRFDAADLHLRGRIRCERCGVATTSPWPSPDELAAAYSGWYRPDAGRFGGLGDKLFRRTRGYIARRLDRIAPPGPILDIGAGDGTLVDALIGKGRSATGLDPYASRSDFLRTEIDQVTGRWAGVVLWHSLEHLPAPTKALQSASQLLQPNGVLLIAVPNAASIQAKVFGDRWFPLDLPRHLVHIPAEALMTSLRELGFRIERVSHVRGGQIVFGWLHGLVGSLFPKSDLYDAIRIPEARSKQLSGLRRISSLLAAAALFPVAAIATLIEVGARRSGTIYIEARASR